MKLLFDHKLSPHLIRRLADLYPGSSHVSICGLAEADDREIWEFARSQGMAIVTKDSDFNDLAALRGAPPKVIWLRIGNCTTVEIERLLREHREDIAAFETDRSTTVLALL